MSSPRFPVPSWILCALLVVPALATQKNGLLPSARSRAIAAAKASDRIRNESSTSIETTLRSGSPAMRAALRTQWWTCSLA